MPSYPSTIHRCEHLKTNGVQCGSPSMRDQQYCYFHSICHRRGKDALLYLDELQSAMLPTLEDANSIQLGLAAVIRQLIDRDINHKTAALILYALQTASTNLKRTTLEPQPTLVVIDRESMKERPIGATAWSKVEGRDYDELESDEPKSNELKNNEPEKNESPNPEMPAAFHQSSQPKNGPPRNKLSPEHKRSDESTMRLAARPGRDPKFLDLPAVDYVSEHETNSSSA